MQKAFHFSLGRFLVVLGLLLVAPWGYAQMPSRQCHGTDFFRAPTPLPTDLNAPVGTELYRITKNFTVTCGDMRAGEQAYFYMGLVDYHPIARDPLYSFWISFNGAPPVQIPHPPVDSARRIATGSFADAEGKMTATYRVTLIARKKANPSPYGDDYIPAAYKIFHVYGERFPDPNYNASVGVLSNGQLGPIARTCTISVNGGGNSNAISLPTVTTSQFTAVGRPVSAANVQIALSNCMTGSTVTHGVRVRAAYTGAAIDRQTGQLQNDDGGAVNVQVGLFNTDGSAINLAQPADRQNAATFTIENGNATMQYVAKYVATGLPVQAGRVNTRVQYDLTYP